VRGLLADKRLNRFLEIKGLTVRGSNIFWCSNGLGLSRSALGLDASRDPSAFYGKIFKPQPRALPPGERRNFFLKLS
jgi:hypothetical protein